MTTTETPNPDRDPDDTEYDRYRHLIFPGSATPDPDDAEYDTFKSLLFPNRNQ